jgi:transcriptional regulator with XRE-family HTH domain
MMERKNLVGWCCGEAPRSSCQSVISLPGSCAWPETSRLGFDHSRQSIDFGAIGRIVNTVYSLSNVLDIYSLTVMQKSDNGSTAAQSDADVHLVRRENLLLLLREFSQARIARGEPTNGTEKAFAEQLQVSKSLLSQLKSSRNISDAIAKQIEARCKKPEGWLSQERTEVTPRPAPGEEAFLALARAAYRAADPEGRAQLRNMLAERG